MVHLAKVASGNSNASASRPCHGMRVVFDFTEKKTECQTFFLTLYSLNWLSGFSKHRICFINNHKCRVCIPTSQRRGRNWNVACCTKFNRTSCLSCSYRLVGSVSAYEPLNTTSERSVPNGTEGIINLAAMITGEHTSTGMLNT